MPIRALVQFVVVTVVCVSLAVLGPGPGAVSLNKAGWGDGTQQN
jgi:hypothetical protein